MRAVTAPDFESLRTILAREVASHRVPGALPALTIVAPSERASRTLRLDLAERLGGTLAIRVVSWPRWLDERTLPHIHANRGVLLSEAGFDQLVARVLDEQAAGVDVRRDPLLRIAGTPGLARSVAATFRDFLEAGFTPEDFDRADAQRDPLRPPLFRLFRSFRDALVHERLWDRRRREALAAELVGAELVGGEADGTEAEDAPPPPATDAAERIFLFGFHDLTPLQRRFLDAMNRRGTSLTLLVPGPSGSDGSEPGESAAAPLLEWLAERGTDLEVTDRTDRPNVTITDGLFAVAALQDPGDALELGTYPNEAAEVRGIAGRILEEVSRGRRPDDFLITVAPGGPSPEVFRRIFARAGLPLEDRIGVAGHRTAAGRRALMLARALTSPDEDEQAGLAFLPEVESEEAGTEAGAGDRAAAGASAPWQSCIDPFVASRTASEAASRFRELYTARFEEAPRPEIEEALSAIETVHGARPLSAREFTGAFAGALSAGRSRGTADGPAVLLVSVSAARFERRPVVFHANRVEGSMRPSAHADPLLSDRARRHLNDRHEHAGRRLAVREDQHEEHLLLARFAFETATERTVLSWSERARTGSEIRNPAGLLLELANRRAGRPLEAGTAAFADVAPYPDPERARRRPVDPTDLDLALLGSGVPPSESDLTRVLEEPRARHLTEALRAAERRWTDPRLTSHDGVLSDERAIRRVERMLKNRSWSPTALESLANCPFAYLLRLLKLDDERAIEDDFDPMERGRIFHEWIERIYSRLVHEKELPLNAARLPRALSWLEEHLQGQQRALIGQPVRRRLQRQATLRSLRDDVAILLARESELPEDERPTPVRIEMGFGRDGEDEPGATLRVAGGERIGLRGKIDRVDRRADGRMEVIDYKTGMPRAKSGALRFSVNGKEEVRLQLPIYLEAARSALGVEPARAYYSFATTDHDFQQIEFTAGDLEGTRPELETLLAHLLDRARHGWFPCTPGQACCRPSVSAACGPGVVSRFHRKAADADLSHHLDVVRGRSAEEEANA